MFSPLADGHNGYEMDRLYVGHFTVYPNAFLHSKY